MKSFSLCHGYLGGYAYFLQFTSIEFKITIYCLICDSIIGAEEKKWNFTFENKWPGIGIYEIDLNNPFGKMGIIRMSYE